MICSKLKEKFCSLLKCSKESTKDNEKIDKQTEISFDDFVKLDLRGGKVEDAQSVDGSDKLIKTIVSFGDEKKVVVSGIKKYRSPQELIGKKFVYITNLPPRKIFGIESQAMILAATDNSDFALISIDNDIKEGAKIS